VRSAADALVVNVSTPLSGLMAAQVMFDVTANNIANGATAGFRPSSVKLGAVAPDNGVAVTGIAADGDVPPPGESGTDLATEAVGLTVARTLYAANARVLSLEEDTMGVLFDERA
jgi:flagellar hook protein FlgE